MDVLHTCVKKSKHEDGHSSRADQCNNGWAQSTKDCLNTAEVAVFIVKMCQNQTDDKGWDDASKGADDSAEWAGQSGSNEGG